VHPRSLEIWIVSQFLPPALWGYHRACLASGRATRRAGTPRASAHGQSRSHGSAPRDADPPGSRWSAGAHLRVPSHGARACVTLVWPRARSGTVEARPGRPLAVPARAPPSALALRQAQGVKSEPSTRGAVAIIGDTRYFSAWLRGSALRLDRRLAVSAEAARFAAAHFPGPYVVVPNGVDLTRFAPAEGTTADETRRATEPAAGARILYVGRLDPRKGLAHLLEACGALCSARSPAGGLRPQLVLVGEWAAAGTLERQAVRRGLPVRFAGALAAASSPASMQKRISSPRRPRMARASGSLCWRRWRRGAHRRGRSTRLPETSPAPGPRSSTRPTPPPSSLRPWRASPPTGQAARDGLSGSRFVRRYDWATIAGRVEKSTSSLGAARLVRRGAGPRSLTHRAPAVTVSLHPSRCGRPLRRSAARSSRARAG